MAFKEAKSFAEAAARKWMAENGMSEENFNVLMNGRRALLTDANGDSITLMYDGTTREVTVEE